MKIMVEFQAAAAKKIEDIDAMGRADLSQPGMKGVHRINYTLQAAGYSFKLRAL